jgi:hypothetical protein
VTARTEEVPPVPDDDPFQAEQIADLLLPLGGPYDPDQVIETARTVAELVRRLNHATFSRSALAYPPQLYRAVSSLRSGLYGLRQTLGQIATRLDAFAADPRVGHDSRRDDPATACHDAARALRQAAAALDTVTGPLDTASQITSHLDYNPTAFPRPDRIPPHAPAPPTTDIPPATASRRRPR